MVTVPHVTSGSGLRKFRGDGFLSDRVYINTKYGEQDTYTHTHTHTHTHTTCI